MRKIIKNPDNDFFIEYLKPYYVRTIDGQYLFGCTQPGRRPDRAFYMVPEGFKLGYGQKSFPVDIGQKIYKVAMEYLDSVDMVVQESIQGEDPYKTGVQITTSVDCPHSAYIPWIGKHMTFPHDGQTKLSCFNFIVPEILPEEYAEKIREFWPEYDPKVPLTLYDFTGMEKDVRKVLSLRVDYFGGAYKKPNLTMVWNRGEADGLVSYHGGCTLDRIVKGLSGTGKTTLTVGPMLEQDDALLGKVIYQNDTAKSVTIIGLEAASFAKSEGLTPSSPEWAGLMRAKETTVIAMNIDCENVNYEMEPEGRHLIRVPRVEEGKKAGRLLTTEYERSGTKNGRFIFDFSALNPNWNREKKDLKAEALVFKRYNTMEPMFRVVDPRMAVALDSACESIITSAVSGKKAGAKVRSYAATDFMAREQSQQALLKWKIYEDMDLSLGGNLIFFIMNSGYVGRNDIEGNTRKDKEGNPLGEKIRVEDSKRLLELIDNDEISEWISNPIFGHLVPNPRELEDKGVREFSSRFNLMRYYTAEQILDFAKQDINERTSYLKDLFHGQEGEEELRPIIEFWNNIKLPDKKAVERFYKKNYS
ncbi:MAG: hypothetical protein JW825_05130 [Candidatus Methanofastidiosa archaeon]|nr:hypothetical protein [Candidatus Methanofastidiosa archaeon]